jgi:serine/threonine protein kinase
VIADLDGAKIFNSITSVQRLSSISMCVGTPEWISPEMRKSISENVTSELPKSDIFSLGLIALYCLDTAEFTKQLSPILSQFKINLNKNEISDHLYNLENALKIYLDDFRLRNLKNPDKISFFYMLKSMLSFSPSARPSIQQLYEDFPLLEQIKQNNDELLQKVRSFGK